MGNSTKIVVTEVRGSDVPAALRASTTLERTYKLEPAGTQFVVPARAKVTLPLGAPGDLVALALDSSGNGNVEVAEGQSIDDATGSLVLEADVAHFSYAIINRFPGVAATLTATPPSALVGETIRLDMVVFGTTNENLSLTTDDAGGAEIGLLGVIEVIDHKELPDHEFSRGVPSEARGVLTVKCLVPGMYALHWRYRFYDMFVAAFFGGLLSPVGAQEVKIVRERRVSFECKAPVVAPSPVVALGLFPLPGLTAPDGINYFAGPFAGMTGAGPYAAVAGADGVKVVDLVTRQVVLDRTAAGPDGATLGTMPLGVVAVAQAASASAPAALIGYGAQGFIVQNWSATQWGGSVLSPNPTFDAVTPGNALVADSVAIVRPLVGVDFVSYDATTMSYKATTSRFAPYAAFPGTSNLAAAQMPDEAAGHLLVLGRASGPTSTATSTKVFYKNVDDAQTATTLLSFGSVEARRLRCIPVGTQHACVVGLTGSGQGKAFLWDPASPLDTPRVASIPAAAGTLGVALKLLPNGHVGVVLANFSANSLTVAELSADLDTIHSSVTIDAPSGCLAVAHVALFSDSEGVKAVVTCNGSGNYWVSRPFG